MRALRFPPAAAGAPRRPRRVGVYGGTFDPVHVGHLILAEELRERLRLDRVLFVPAGEPPHKRGPAASGAERLAMVRLAIRGNAGFAALDLELRRGGASYTVETLRTLRGRLGADAALFFLLGMDAFAEIATWREAAELPRLAHFAVFPRAGSPLTQLRRSAPRAWRLSPPRRAGRGVTTHEPAAGLRLYAVETETLSISASRVRERAGRGESIRYLVPAAVERHIARRGLYRRTTKGA